MTTKKEIELVKLADFYETDKLQHGYLPYYAKYLPSKINKFLEVGCFKGASVQMWKDFFKNKTEIHTFDLFQEFPHVKPEMESKGIVCYAGNQHLPSDLYQIKDIFDVIISDGSHYPGLEQTTFYHLFINNLNPGGVYFLEDAHTSLDNGWWDEGVNSFDDTILNFFENWQNDKFVSTFVLKEHEINVLKQNIESVKVMCDRKLVMITKKY